MRRPGVPRWWDRQKLFPTGPPLALGLCMSMHSDWERGVDLQGSVGLHQGAALPSLGTSVVSALGWPASGDARLVTRKERGSSVPARKRPGCSG